MGKKQGLLYLCPLEEWQAAPTLASSLLQFANTLQPKTGETLIIQRLAGLQIAQSGSWTGSDDHQRRVRGQCLDFHTTTDMGTEEE